VLLGRIELSTSSLPLTRSTTELQQHLQERAPMRRDGHNVKHLARWRALWQGAFMKKQAATTKDERLAQALRANLRRRKAPAKSEPEIAHDPSSPKSGDLI
jgi:hypothetical protein